jgi:DNA-binding NarL/FixJ family response regulator
MLVAAGQTNKAIADALYVSPNTVKTHVSSLLHKLRADTRVQLAAIATKHGLY